MKNTIIEMKNILERSNSRLEDPEQISDLEDRKKGKHKLNSRKKKRIKQKDYRLRDLLGNTKQTNICIIRVPEEEEREKGENLFEEILSESFPKLEEETDIQVQETQTVRNKMNLRRSTPQHT